MSDTLTKNVFGPYVGLSADSARAYVRAQYPLGCGVEAYARALCGPYNVDGVSRVVVAVDLYDDETGEHAEYMEWIVWFQDGRLHGEC